jgi:hypothetical protein
MSISQNFPAISPTLNLNFARSKKLDPRITFTRTSSATRTNAQGLIEVVSTDTPRFEHSYNGSVVESLGLLIEEQRINLVTDNATDFNYSFNTQIIPTANDVAPNGTTVLCKHDLTGGTQPFLNCRANTTLNAGTYSISMWLKGATSFSASFAFVGETTSEIYANTANITTTWQRFTLSFTLLATQTLSRLQLFFGTQGEGKIVSVWGAQLEAGAFVTSYIPRSSGAQATRSADSASMTGTNFSSWYNSTEGTLFAAARINALGGSTYPGIVYVDDGTVNNCIGFYINDAASDNIGAEAYISNVGQYQIGSSSAIVPNQLNKVITAYKVNDFAAVFSMSGTVGTDTSGSIPTVNRLIIGLLRGSQAPLNGTISQLSYYPRRLTNTQLQNLTK